MKFNHNVVECEPFDNVSNFALKEYQIKDIVHQF